MNEAKERDLEMFALFHIHPLFFFFFFDTLRYKAKQETSP